MYICHNRSNSMNIRCLLIKTKDKKEFFTLVKNKKQLTEYCKTFGAKMLTVKAEIDRSQILDLPKLVTALCDKNYKNQNIKYKKIKTTT